MRPNCEIDTIQTVNFGVGRDDDQSFVIVPADGSVQDALKEMLVATCEAMERLGEPRKYEPSEKHESVEFLYLSTNDPLAQALLDLHAAANLPVDTAALGNSEYIFSYFGQFIDANGKRVTALRRASQFKGILKNKNRLMRIIDDTLEIIPDNVFKLDTEFDLLIDDDNVLILRPGGFESAGKLKDAILAAVPENIDTLRQEISFVNFDSIMEYARTRSRAARHLASIRSHPNNDKITIDRLQAWCKRTGVEVNVMDGCISVAEKHEMAFLELLDRRRYDVDLTEDPELYRAPSRIRVNRQ